MGESAATETSSRPDAGSRSEPDEDAYGGVFGAIPYAFRASSSWLLRSYVVAGGLLAALASVLMVLALVVLLGATASTAGGTLTLSRAFYVVVALSVVGPLLAPILLVARRHRLGRTTGNRYDAALALAGYLFVLALYVGLVISVPARFREPTGGALAPVVEVLYALPGLAGLAPPTLAAVSILLVHRALR